mgnify:CR=1 FL=1
MERIGAERVKVYLNRLPNKQSVPLEKLYPNASHKTLDLLGKMLVLDPKERVSVEDALGHSFLSKYHDVDDEPACFPTFDFDFEQIPFSKEKLKEAIAQEIKEFHINKWPELVLRPRNSIDISETHIATDKGESSKHLLLSF